MYPVDSSRVEEGNGGEDRQAPLTVNETGQDHNAVGSQEQNGKESAEAGLSSKDQNKKIAKDDAKPNLSKKND